MENNVELRVGVKALLKNPEEKYLLIKRNTEKYPEIQGVWDIPGGRIEAGIGYFENLKREIREETHLDLIEEPKLLAAQDILRVPGKHVVRLTFVGAILGEPILDLEENTEYLWLTFEELKDNTFNLDLDSYLKEAVDKYLSSDNQISAVKIEKPAIDPDVPSGRYQHFKGSICRVIGVARHSETKEQFVVYQHLDNLPEFGLNSLWIRPKDMFLENVNVPRFKYLSDN